MPYAGDYHGKGLGEFGYPKLLPGSHPHSSGRILDRIPYRPEADDSVSQDREQGIEEHGQESRLPSETKDRKGQYYDSGGRERLDESIHLDYQLLEILSSFSGNEDTDAYSYEGCQSSRSESERKVSSCHLQHTLPAVGEFGLGWKDK